MILICGIPSETPLKLVTEQLERAGAGFVMLNQRHFQDYALWFEVNSAGIDGELCADGVVYSLKEFNAIYHRVMDFRSLPELEGEVEGSALWRRCQAFHETLVRWIEVAPGAVVNRSYPMCSNGSKPYQIQLIREQGFAVPETLVTNDPRLVRQFCAKHGKVIYKSASAVRSIVQTLTEEDMERLENIRWCPTQFQAFVEGTNVRVHTVGGEVFATEIQSEATDYRYAKRQVGDSAELAAIKLSDELEAKCLKLSHSLGLEFAGIDLKFTPEGRVYCFEVNPSPAYSYFEQCADQPISAGVARRLMSA